MKDIFWVIYLTILSIFDHKECKIPVITVVIGFICSVLWVLWECFEYQDPVQWILLTAVLGCVPGTMMLLVGWLSKKIGLGDGLVLLCVGMVVGYERCFVLLCGSLLLMSAWCMCLLVRRKGNRSTAIPYLPFLTVVYLVGMFL